MYLSQVRIKNFRGYGEYEGSPDNCFVYDELDSPLVIFHGYNGFGKTSFFEAVEWCLTDNVYRLEKFYVDKTYQANELKRSHYLKFYHPKYGNNELREIYVELLFDNGLRIVRRSNNKVLRTTDKDASYSSKVFMGINELVETTTEEVLHKFISKTKDKEAFFHTHMLGQESISDFLRNNSPSQRREIFMHLLQEEELNNLYQALSKFQAKNNSLTLKYNDLTTKSVNLRTYQQEITDFIKKLGFDDIIHYIKAINDDYTKIKLVLTSSDLGNLPINASLLVAESGIGFSNCVEYLKTLSAEHQKIVAFRDDLNSKYEELLRLNKRFETFSLLEQAKVQLQRSEAAARLKLNNSDSLSEQIRSLNQKIVSCESSIDSIQRKKVTLEEYRYTFLPLSKYISSTDVDERFWAELIQEQVKWEKFVIEFKSELEVNIENLGIEDIDKEWFREIQRQLINIQDTKKQLNENLEDILSQKKSVSLLNVQYQEALIHVKKLINDNFQSTDKCPVCLNEDFSNPKYSSLQGWESSSSIAEKIILIIDSTFAAGNEQVALLVEREKEIHDKIRSLENQYSLRIEQPLRVRLDNINQKFKEKYDVVEKHLQKELIAQSAIKDSSISTRNETQLQLNRIRESIISLFGNEIKLEELETSLLDQIITQSQEWFLSNLSETGFSSSPSISEVESELALLRKEYLNGNEHESVKTNLESTKKKLAAIESLIALIKEVLNKKLPDEYEVAVVRYEKLGELISSLESEKQKIEEYRSEASKWHGRLLGKQRQIVKERLENHPIISWVYETINPHPFHKSLHITNTERGTNFIGQTQLEDKIDLYLDQIFSAAQLNILALSIFLGLGLTQRYSQLQQLFMDDPIQSMDDVNILAFIDVLRAIMDSKYSNKHIVVSTHDEDFAQLLSIKMRNRKMVQYRIVGYTEEGPQIIKMK